MLNIKQSPFLILIVFLSATWILLCKIQKTNVPKYHMIKIFVPKDEDSLSQFSSHYILNLIKNKNQVHTELDDDKFTNQKKLSFIQYEARKLKYLKDTNSVINISITKEVSYSEVLQLLNICFEDGHKRFVLLKNRFVIFGEYPSPKRDTTNIIKPIYL